MARGKHAWNDILDVKRWRKSGDLGQLRVKLWRTIVIFEQGMNDAMARQDGDEVRKWGHGLHQLAGTYLKIVQDGEMEKRLTALEEQLHATPISRTP